MGRRPNPIVVEHFERGGKHDDGSNRYVHTCRNCGEKFIKGRHEHLASHMTDECPNLTDAQRATILLKLHGLEHAATAQNGNGTATNEAQNFDLPFTPSRIQNFDGLNVLAEASRRVGIQTPKKKSKNANNPLPLDPTLGQDLPSEFVNHSDDGLESYVSAANEFPATSAPLYSPLFSYMPAQLTSGPLIPTRLTAVGIGLEDSSNAARSDLSSVAASANETLAHSLNPHMFHAVAGQASGASLDPDHVMREEVVEEAKQSRVFSWTSQAQGKAHNDDDITGQQIQGTAAFPRPIAINPDKNKSTLFVAETGTAAKPVKVKHRNAFNLERKKEVRAMRSQGVCSRCRMLKKPCDPGTPCEACKTVEHSRLWGPCSRWQLKKDLKFYMTPLHSSLAQSDLLNIKNQIGFQPFEGHISVSLIGGSPANMSVPAQRGQNGSHALHPQYGISMQRHHYQKSEDIFIFSIGRMEFTAELHHHILGSLESFISREKSARIRTSLQTAHKLVKDEGSKLLKLALELWVLTYILSSTDLDTTFEVIAKDVSTTQSPGRVRHFILEGCNMYSYSLLSSQLRAAVSDRAAEVRKLTLAAFEAHFMRGPSTAAAVAARFDAFLAAVIVVNAAERYMWLFKVFEGGLPENKPWPLDASPAELVEQAEKVAIHLDYLLKVRHISDTLKFDENGRLNITEIKSKAATDWLQAINIRTEDLVELKSTTFDVNDFTSLDGQFYSRLLAPLVPK